MYSFNLSVKLCDLSFNELDLFDDLAKLEGKVVDTDGNSQRVLSHRFDLKCFPFANVTFRCSREVVGQLRWVNAGDLFRCGIGL